MKVRPSFIIPIFLSVGLILATLPVTSGCGGGGNTDVSDAGGEPVSVNTIDGATDVAVDSSFSFTFTPGITQATVTEASYFIVPLGEPSAQVVKGASFDPVACNPASAILAEVRCPNTTQCDLTPASSLNGNTRYTICLTTAITYLNGLSFEGFTATFTTAGTATDGAASYIVGGSLTGIDDGEQVILQCNGADDLTVSQNGEFDFATEVTDGSEYAVTVLGDPATKTCTVSNGTGTISGADVTDVSVVCSIDTYTVGGTLSGLDIGDELILQNNSTDDLTVTDNGTFTFDTVVADGGGFQVTVLTSPNQKTCTVSNGTGTISGGDATDVSVVCIVPQPAQWAKSTTAGTATSIYYGVGNDADGNSYAAGTISTGEFNFGNGVTVTGAPNGSNVAIVKYNSDGVAQWAKSTTAGTNGSIYYGVTVASDGTVHAVGTTSGADECNFGNGKIVSGAGGVIVQYNSDGVAQWAVGGETEYKGVSTDSDGNSYVVGHVSGPTAVIVKYNSAGVVQWTKPVSGGSGSSYYDGVSTDTAGNTYAVGSMYGNVAFNFGNGVSASGASTGYNLVIVKYNTSGDAQWAKSVTQAPSISFYHAASVDTNGNVYAAGKIEGTGEYNFGNSKTVSGTFGSSTVVIVKYNSAGDAQWVKSIADPPKDSYFYGVSTDSNGNAYAAGLIYGANKYNFGNGIAVSGAYTAINGLNVAIIKYSSDGVTLWGKSVTVGTDDSRYLGVSVDSSGNAYVVGRIRGTGEFGFGNGVTASGTNTSANVVIVKY